MILLLSFLAGCLVTQSKTHIAEDKKEEKTNFNSKKYLDGNYYSIALENKNLWTIETKKYKNKLSHITLNFYSSNILLKNNIFPRRTYICVKEDIICIAKSELSIGKGMSIVDMVTNTHIAFHCKLKDKWVYLNKKDDEFYFNTSCRGMVWDPNGTTTGGMQSAMWVYAKPRLKVNLSGTLSKIILTQSTSWKNINNIELKLSKGTTEKYVVKKQEKIIAERKASKVRAHKENIKLREEKARQKELIKLAQIENDKKKYAKRIAKLEKAEKARQSRSIKIANENDNLKLALEILNYTATGSKSGDQFTISNKDKCIFYRRLPFLDIIIESTYYIDNIIPNTINYTIETTENLLGDLVNRYVLTFNGDKIVMNDNTLGNIWVHPDADLDRVKKAWRLMFSKACKGASAGEF